MAQAQAQARTNTMLTTFASYLAHHGMIKLGVPRKDEDADLENVTKLQKYAYFARYFGLDLGYVYNAYLHGPYSYGLSSDYDDMYATLTASASAPRGLKQDEFLSAMKGRDIPWLDVAATILDMISTHEEIRPDGTSAREEILLDYIHGGKCEYKPKFIDSVYQDLKDLRLL